MLLTGIILGLAAIANKNKKPYRKVLLVDDDSTSRYLSKMLLQEFAIAESIIGLPSVPEGINYIYNHCINEKAAKQECPDLILLELHINGPDGFDFLKRLQELGQTNLIQVKVVVLSTHIRASDQQQLDNFGVRHFLEKPITEEKLLALTGSI